MTADRGLFFVTFLREKTETETLAFKGLICYNKNCVIG